MYLRQHPTYRRLSTHFSHGAQPQTGGDFADRERTASDFGGWERIGRGGFGKVYRAQPRDTRMYSGRTAVAIKVVDKRALRDSAAEQRLATEVAVHETLEHTHIVRLLDSFEDDRYVYLVMEHCPHGDLWRYLRARRAGGEDLSALTEPEARWVMRQIGTALAHLHARGVLHRDLKLANIMLAQNMDVRVGDFGLATRVGHHDGLEPTTMCGTPSYISPEIMARQPYGLESDVWALGCLFVTLLTGTQPFRNVTRITDHAVRAIQLPHDLSSEAHHLVRALLRIDPRQRIRCDELLAHPFFNSMLVQTPLAPLDHIHRSTRILQPVPPRHPDAHVSRRRAEPRAAVSEEEDAFAMPRSTEPRSTHFRPHSADLTYTRRTHIEPPTTTAHAPVAPGRRPAAVGTSASAPSLEGFSTRRLQTPLRRTLKNGKVYVRTDHLLILDLTTSTNLVAIDEPRQRIYEFQRPVASLDQLGRQTASREYAWDLHALPDRVAKPVRVAIRCVAYLLGQQKRIRIATPQGKGYLFDDLQTFKFVFFNRIRVEASRARMEATVEIPSSQDLPDEIQKVPLSARDFGDNSDDDSCARPARGVVPEKVRGIIVHVREALRQVWALDTLLREFEPAGRLHAMYDGQIRFPVDLQWNARVDELGFVPAGLAKRDEKENRKILAANAGARPASIAHTTGSTTVISSRKQRHYQPQQQAPSYQPQQQQQSYLPQQQQQAYQPQQQQQWGKHVLDRRTVDDTPTRRLNLGPITRLVEEFNQHQKPAPANPAAFLQTPGSLLQLHTPAHRAGSDIARLIMQQTFENVCFMPQVGWCMAAEGHAQDDYIITMLFCDGCRVLVNVRDQTVRFKDGAVEYDDLPIDHSMPARVKERLTFLPQFLGTMGLGI
ncbi:hypothetical protein IWW50_003481 [Coemansia erecta]|nr:hypothetical protein IWW50_003481 [Coemansia erecta]